jgi:LPXTG-site transpeptidase (sortase) family protein
VTVTDPLPGLSAISCPGDTLPPAGGWVDCSATYAVTQADINAGQVDNTATVDSDQTGPDSDDETVPLAQNPAMVLTKTGVLNNAIVAPPGESNPNDTITYTFSIENTGNITLTNIVVTDPSLPTLDCSIASLAVGAIASCPATNNVYDLLQTDIDAGQVDNTATANSIETGPVTDDESVPLIQIAALSIEKMVSEDDSTWFDQVWVDVGDTVYFRIRVENTGNLTLTGLVIEDGMAGCILGSKTDVIGDGDLDFEVGEIWQYTCDLAAEAGIQTNTATADTDQTLEVSDDATYVGGNIFDPPSGVKTVNELGEQVLRWTMVWINNTNTTALDATVSDPIPANSAYDGGISCTDESTITDTTACYFEAPSGAYPRGRIVWEGVIGPDLGASNATEAEHEIVISFNIIVDDGVLASLNVATLNADLNGDGDFDDPGETPSASADAEWEGEPELPPTGFAPNTVTTLDESQRQTYTAISRLELEIPSLGIRMPIVWIPSAGTSWDVTWLGYEAGLLEGTAYPGWAGNSALAGHLHLPTGAPGPFADLTSLIWGDEIIVHAHGLRHTYMVLEREYVLPGDNSVLRHEEYPWLTLITCHDYDETLESFNYRYVVRAVKIRVEAE